MPQLLIVLLAGVAAGALNSAGPRTILAGQFVLAIYGGYFGGAVGLLMVAFWSIAAGIDPARGNPLRVAQLAARVLRGLVLSSAITVTAVYLT